MTDEFITHLRASGSTFDLDQASEFLVVAATLLDLKAARLLPSGSVEDEDDLALLEARDLLFARLLQYRAYKEVAGLLSSRFIDESRRFPRLVGDSNPASPGSSPRSSSAWGRPNSGRSQPERSRPVRSRAFPLRTCTRRWSACESKPFSSSSGCVRYAPTTFRALTEDADLTLLVVARFLALLDLYRDGAVAFEQVTPLGELHVRWTASDEFEIGQDMNQADNTPEVNG